LLRLSRTARSKKERGLIRSMPAGLRTSAGGIESDPWPASGLGFLATSPNGRLLHNKFSAVAASLRGSRLQI
jgi:hypothetical protein